MHPCMPDARQAYPPAPSEGGPAPAFRTKACCTTQAPNGTTSPHRQAGRGRLASSDGRPKAGDQAALTASIRRSVIWLRVARLAETVIVSLSFAGTKSRTWLPEDSPAQP